MNIRNSINILIADYEPTSALQLANELNKEGYSTCVVSTAQDAIDELQARQYDLLITEIKLQPSPIQMDGFDVMKHIGQAKLDTKILVLTGFADLKNAIESKRHNVNDFSSKPYDTLDLLTTIERILTQ